jgi:hypothetical protein
MAADGFVDLAVNGTLMRGLALNKHLTDIQARFVREAWTVPEYRLWSIDDRYPAMVRTTTGHVTSVHVEVWSLPLAGLARVLLREPPGLTVGKILLDTGEEVLGVLGEPALVEGHREITEHGGWREYLAANPSASLVAESLVEEASQAIAAASAEPVATTIPSESHPQGDRS